MKISFNRVAAVVLLSGCLWLASMTTPQAAFAGEGGGSTRTPTPTPLHTWKVPRAVCGNSKDCEVLTAGDTDNRGRMFVYVHETRQLFVIHRNSTNYEQYEIPPGRFADIDSLHRLLHFELIAFEQDFVVFFDGQELYKYDLSTRSLAPLPAKSNWSVRGCHRGIMDIFTTVQRFANTNLIMACGSNGTSYHIVALDVITGEVKPLSEPTIVDPGISPWRRLVAGGDGFVYLQYSEHTSGSSKAQTIHIDRRGADSSVWATIEIHEADLLKRDITQSTLKTSRFLTLWAVDKASNLYVDWSWYDTSTQFWHLRLAKLDPQGRVLRIYTEYDFPDQEDPPVIGVDGSFSIVKVSDPSDSRYAWEARVYPSFIRK